MTYMIELTQRERQPFSKLGYSQYRLIISNLIAEGIVLNYAESMDREKFWLMLEALSELEVFDIISDLPILGSLKVKVIPLYTNVSNFSHGAVYSLN
ncbi:MAG: hypothetical protein QNK63_06480 [Flavobacteriales bacterium]|mgnify:FL=1|jgi:hypothetical protein